jgi:hypothetical protein
VNSRRPQVLPKPISSADVTTWQQTGWRCTPFTAIVSTQWFWDPPTIPTDQSHHWESNSVSASEEFPCISWNPKVHYLHRNNKANKSQLSTVYILHVSAHLESLSRIFKISPLLGYYAASSGTRRRVISQKSTDVINIAAEAWNQGALSNYTEKCSSLIRSQVGPK